MPRLTAWEILPPLCLLWEFHETLHEGRAEPVNVDLWRLLMALYNLGRRIAGCTCHRRRRVDYLGNTKVCKVSLTTDWLLRPEEERPGKAAGTGQDICGPMRGRRGKTGRPLVTRHVTTEKAHGLLSENQ